MRPKRKFLLVIILLFCIAITNSGCNNFNKLLNKNPDTSQTTKLIKVEIHFTDATIINAYIKELGIGKEDKLYNGGSSLNNYYDAKGNLLGVYNYQHVMYIKLMPEA